MFVAQTISVSWLPPIATFISILTAVYFAVLAYRKAKPEATAILVDAAKDIVILQKGELQRLQTSLAECHTKIESLQTRVDELLMLNKELGEKLTEEEKKSRKLERRLDALDNVK